MLQKHHVDRPDIVMVLDKIGSEICKNNEQYFTYLVTSTSTEGILIETSLYIIAPEISYEYKAISVEILNVVKLKIRFITLATKQSEAYDVDISKGLLEYESKLNEIAHYGLFRAALESLINQVLIRREYKISPIRKKIIPGQARVAVLHNGEHINAGWIRLEGEDVVYYTGKGLREMWKPKMTSEEQERANILKAKNEGELIEAGLIAKSKISEFKDIL